VLIAASWSGHIPGTSRRDLPRSNENHRDLSRRSDRMRGAFAPVREMLHRTRSLATLRRPPREARANMEVPGALAQKMVLQVAAGDIGQLTDLQPRLPLSVMSR
jgi:hypothetical protein